MDRTVNSSDWTFLDLSNESTKDYGETTKYVIESNVYRTAIRIAPSEGMHIMKCPRGSWQVSMPRHDHFIDRWDEEHNCFDTEEEALDFAVDWIESL